MNKQKILGQKNTLEKNQQKGALGNQPSIWSLLFFAAESHMAHSIFNWGVLFQIYAEESYFKHILNKERSIKTGSPLL